MDNIFYYLGVMYVVINIRRIFKHLDKSRDLESKELINNFSKSMPSDITTITNLDFDKMKSSSKQIASKASAAFVISIFFIIWIAVGYFYTTEWHLFLALFIISLTALLSPAIHFIISICTSKEPIQKSAINIINGVKNSEVIRNMSILEFALKIIITTGILIQHFS